MVRPSGADDASDDGSVMIRAGKKDNVFDDLQSEGISSYQGSVMMRAGDV